LRLEFALNVVATDVSQLQWEGLLLRRRGQVNLQYIKDQEINVARAPSPANAPQSTVSAND